MYHGVQGEGHLVEEVQHRVHHRTAPQQVREPEHGNWGMGECRMGECRMGECGIREQENHSSGSL